WLVPVGRGHCPDLGGYPRAAWRSGRTVYPSIDPAGRVDAGAIEVRGKDVSQFARVSVGPDARIRSATASLGQPWQRRLDSRMAWSPPRSAHQSLHQLSARARAPITTVGSRHAARPAMG